MPRKATPAELLSRARLQSARMAGSMGQRRLLKLLKGAQADLNRRLFQASQLRGPGADSFTATQLQATLRQVQDVIANLNANMASLVGDQAKVAAERAAGQTVKYLSDAERKFKGVSQPLPLREAEMLDRVARGSEASALRRMAGAGGREGAGVLQRYGVATINKFEEKLQLGLATRKSLADIRDELVGQSPFLQQAPRSWAERIVRTETMRAYNAAGHEAITEAQSALGDMVKILSATFDDRTGWDSYQVHGQIRRPEEPFDWAGKQYMHPPNRPNDREIVVPHRISWPIPASLEPRSDSEVMERYYRDRTSGAPPPRPEMTTVPLEQFGKA